MMSSSGPMGGDMSVEPPPDFGRHNMFAFGRNAVFLSHLPMFMAPHDAQLLLEVTLQNEGSELLEVWSKERADHPDDQLYTVMPEKFALSTLYDFDQILSVEPAGPHPGGEELRTGIEVTIQSRANTAKERLRSAEKVVARGHVTGAHEFIDLELEEVRELYFEEGELSTSRGAFEPTPLETEAGFGD